MLAVVKVGAINVGSISCAFSDLRSNASPRFSARRKTAEVYDQGIPVKKGEQIASFNMGSTVVLLSTHRYSTALAEAGAIRYGENLWDG